MGNEFTSRLSKLLRQKVECQFPLFKLDYLWILHKALEFDLFISFIF